MIGFSYFTLDFFTQSNAHMTKPKAFLSHSTNDAVFVKALHQALALQGVNAWIDRRELLPGDLLLPEIEEAIILHEVFFDPAGC